MVYSVELTEEDIEKIDAQTVKAGDWALISVQPFTSVETLTVTMEGGEVFTIRVTDAQISTHVITADGKDFEITVTFGNDAQIPEDARLEADEILPGTDDYEEYYSKTWKALSEERKPDDDRDQPEENNLEEPDSEEPEGHEMKEKEEIGVTFARFFDLRIMSGDDKIEPSAPVKVTVTYADPIEKPEDGNVCAIHFAEKGVEVIEASLDKEAKEVAFTQDSFSVTGTIVATDNTNWPSSNGKYLMYVESEDNYFAVAHDGSLTPITVSNGKITIDISKHIIDSDYLWSYETRSGSLGRTNYFIYYNNGSDDVYLDPRESDGLNDSYVTWSMPTLTRSDAGLIRYSGSSTNQYLGVDDNFIIGNQLQSNAVPVQFAEMPLAVTVHFVDREGNSITGVSYSGNSSYPVTENADGTYSIPYNWEGTTGTVDLEYDFSKSGYTYGSSHIAGTRNGVDFTYDGLTIDAALEEKNNKNLYFKSDCGDQYANPREIWATVNCPNTILTVRSVFQKKLSIPRPMSEQPTISGRAKTGTFMLS